MTPYRDPELDALRPSRPTAELPLFDGATYEPEHDQERLAGQLARVLNLMRDGRWRSLREIAEAVHGSEAGVSARLRDLRKKDFGQHTVNRRARGKRDKGHFEYQLIPRSQR